MILKFKELYHTQKTSYETGNILSAALNGIVDTLFIENEKDIFGTFDLKTNRVIIDKSKNISNTSLTNLAAIETFRQGGKVFLLSAEDMPVKNSNLNAIFRY